jgi:hypothetical protein
VAAYSDTHLLLVFHGIDSNQITNPKCITAEREAFEMSVLTNRRFEYGFSRDRRACGILAVWGQYLRELLGFFYDENSLLAPAWILMSELYYDQSGITFRGTE